jgi:hypothetical protein
MGKMYEDMWRDILWYYPGMWEAKEENHKAWVQDIQNMKHE